MSLRTVIQENAAVVIVGGALTIIGGLAWAGGVSWADGRYVLQTIYNSDNITRGLLLVDDQIKQTEYRIRDAQVLQTKAMAKGDLVDAASARNDEAFYKTEREALLRKRDDILRQ